MNQTEAAEVKAAEKGRAREFAGRTSSRAAATFKDARSGTRRRANRMPPEALHSRGAEGHPPGRIPAAKTSEDEGSAIRKKSQGRKSKKRSLSG